MIALLALCGCVIRLQLYSDISLDFCAKLCIFADLARNKDVLCINNAICGKQLFYYPEGLEIE